MPKDPLKRIVIDNRLANNYAADFERQAKKLNDLAEVVFQANVKGTAHPKGVFKAAACAAQDLSRSLEGLQGEPLERIRLPAAALADAMESSF
jgi:hypothetical protein